MESDDGNYSSAHLEGTNLGRKNIYANSEFYPSQSLFTFLFLQQLERDFRSSYYCLEGLRNERHKENILRMLIDMIPLCINWPVIGGS